MKIKGEVTMKRDFEIDMEGIYEFDVIIPSNSHYKIRTNLETAFRVATNYEADLYINGILLLSPLGLSYEDNSESTQFYLGKPYNEVGYNRLSDVEVVMEL